MKYAVWKKNLREAKTHLESFYLKRMEMFINEAFNSFVQVRYIDSLLLLFFFFLFGRGFLMFWVRSVNEDL